MNRTALINLLKEGTVDISFTKKDGTLRSMSATLKDAEVNGNPITGDSLSVYDTEKSEYRAFRWDSLQTVNGEAVESI